MEKSNDLITTLLKEITKQTELEIQAYKKMALENLKKYEK